MPTNFSQSQHPQVQNYYPQQQPPLHSQQPHQVQYYVQQAPPHQAQAPHYDPGLSYVQTQQHIQA